MTLVWNESRRQADEMLQTFLGHNDGRTDQTVYGLRQIALNVLVSAGYGQYPSWKANRDSPPPGHKLSYPEVLNALADGFILIAVVPSKLLSQEDREPVHVWLIGYENGQLSAAKTSSWRKAVFKGLP